MWVLRRADGSVATGWALMPLRLFLGVTFLYAGLNKLANPDFFRDSSPISIHTQLAGAARTSPIHGLLGHLVSIAPLIGATIALGEVAVGIGTLLGLFSRIAAIGGMLVSLSLFLAVSYHSSPYFTGSDIVFFFAWTPLVLAGAAGAPALDTWLAERRPPSDAQTGAVSRRDVLTRGAVTGLVAGGRGGPLRRWSRRSGRAVGRLDQFRLVAGHPDALDRRDERDHHHDGGQRVGSDDHDRGHPFGHRGRSRLERAGRRLGELHRSDVGRPVTRDPATGRAVHRVRRGVPARRLHRGLRRLRADHRLSVPRLGVRCQQRERAPRPGTEGPDPDHRRQGTERRPLRRSKRPSRAGLTAAEGSYRWRRGSATVVAVPRPGNTPLR